MAREERISPPLMQKKSFIKTGEPSLINYNWTDLASGTGYVVLYGAFQGASPVLLDQVVASHLVETSGADDQQTNFFEQTFELSPFNTPRVIVGKLLASVPVSWFGTNNTSTQRTLTTTITIYRNDTQLGTGSYAVIEATGTGELAVQRRYTLISVDIPQTNFARGDVLKIKVEARLQRTGAGNRGIIGHDPLSREVTNLSLTRLSFFVPFKIDI